MSSLDPANAGQNAPQGQSMPERGRRASDRASERAGDGDRRAVGISDRRAAGSDRRAPGSAGLGGQRSGLERRRGAGRRLSDFGRRAEEGDLTPEQFLFVMAIEEFKRGNEITYPAWTDVLEVIRLLGYRKVAPSEITLRNAEDWREPATAPSNVRPQGWERRFRLPNAEGARASNPTNRRAA